MTYESDTLRTLDKPLCEFNWSDSGNAERFVAAHGSDFRYLHDRKSWWHWDGTRWVPDLTHEVDRAAKATIRAGYADVRGFVNQKRLDYESFLYSSESRHSLEAMVALATREPLVSALSNQFDVDPMLLNVANGTVDLRTGELRPHRREDLLTKRCPVSFDPSAGCFYWLSILEELFADHPEIIGFLQRSIGCSLTGSTEEECFWLLTGAGSNLVLGAIQFVLGDYAVETSFNNFVHSRDSWATNLRDELADLKGARFVGASEDEEQKTLSQARLKTLTGGCCYWPTSKLWLASNQEPRISSRDRGIWRRMHRINFDRVVPKEKLDPLLTDNLLAEADGVLNWFLEGLKAYRAGGGLQVPESVKTAATAYREASIATEREEGWE